jgi:hypothetical protein
MKTAVAWLKEIYDSCNTYEKFISNIDWEQANKMFEEQVTLSHINGQSEFDKGAYGEHNQKLANEYYKQTFKSEE